MHEINYSVHWTRGSVPGANNKLLRSIERDTEDASSSASEQQSEPCYLLGAVALLENLTVLLIIDGDGGLRRRWRRRVDDLADIRNVGDACGQ